ncbi:MAG: MSCRAMM family adhesin SdrC [Acidimicrobiia bacterium]|nr:MSCRAMM family adhesin SdrC [Acidimicrobiia bacterium]
MLTCLGAAAMLVVSPVEQAVAQNEAASGDCSSVVWTEDFGAGAGDVDISTTRGSTPMRWNGPDPKRIGNGEYTITSNLTEDHGGWWFPTSQDHTPDDTEGRMMVVDVADRPQEIYRAAIGGLRPGQTYCVSGWLANANRHGDGRLPNVSFNIFDGSERIAGSGSGDLPNTQSLVWRETSFTFVAPVEQVALSVYDNVGERIGADLAIDDLTITTNGLATLTVRSVTVNDEPTPGTASAADFTVTVTAEDDSSVTASSGAAELTETELPAGRYTLRQSGPSGYDVDLACEGATVAGDQVVVPAGGEVICTFTSDDVDADRDGYADDASVDPDPTSTCVPDPFEDPDDQPPSGTNNDCDGDGIANLTEGKDDPDGDGLPNYIDTDSDGDGIADAVEGETDSDGVGVPDYLDDDSDGDGMSDLAEGVGDADGDGILDFRDADSQPGRGGTSTTLLGAFTGAFLLLAVGAFVLIARDARRQSNGEPSSPSVGDPIPAHELPPPLAPRPSMPPPPVNRRSSSTSPPTPPDSAARQSPPPTA